MLHTSANECQGSSEATALGVLVARFPALEFELHRRSARDPRFRAICADHAEAHAALLHWQAVPGGLGRADEYRALVAELEAEILAQLTPVPPTNAAPSGSR